MRVESLAKIKPRLRLCGWGVEKGASIMSTIWGKESNSLKISTTSKWEPSMKWAAWWQFDPTLICKNIFTGEMRLPSTIHSPTIFSIWLISIFDQQMNTQKPTIDKYSSNWSYLWRRKEKIQSSCFWADPSSLWRSFRWSCSNFRNIFKG